MFMKIDYPSVLLIYTGGTIGMIENPETGALENFNFDHLLKHVPELKRFNYHGAFALGKNRKDYQLQL